MPNVRRKSYSKRPTLHSDSFLFGRASSCDCQTRVDESTLRQHTTRGDFAYSALQNSTATRTRDILLGASNERGAARRYYDGVFCALDVR